MGIIDNIDPVFTFLGLSGFLKHVIHVYRWDRIPSSAKLIGTVSALRLYPFKSALGLEQNEIYCHSSKGPSCGPILDSVHLVPTDALDCGEDACQWISNVLKRANYRIVYCGSNVTTRSVAEGTKNYQSWTRAANPEDMLAFHDSTTIHMLTEESVTDLNKRLPNPLNALRFRPNIVVTTGAEPYLEDTWKYIYIGKARLRTIKLCVRCVLTTINPETGTKDLDFQPLKALSKYRCLLGGKYGPAFGTDLVVDRTGWIKVGDPIYVIPGDNVLTPN